MTLDRTAPDGATPTVAMTEHETVIKFVLSGPLLNGHPIHAVPASEEVGTLRERVDALERALADADARIDALSNAVAAAIASSPVIEPLSESVELLLRRAAAHDRPAIGGSDSWTGTSDAFALPGGSEGDADGNGRAQLPVNGSQPPPQQDDAAPPKVRGLRRMVSALKHQ